MTKKPKHRTGLRFKLITAVVITVIFLILLEYTASVLYRPSKDVYPGFDNDIAALNYEIFEDDPELIQKLMGGLKVIHPRTRKTMETNAMGYRGEPFEMEKPEGMGRVVFLGDGSIFGMGLGLEETLPRCATALLGQRLKGGKVEVINLAVPGYTSFQGVRQALELFPDMEPDVVVIGFGYSDAVLMNHTDAEVQASIPGIQRLFARMNGLLGWSSLYQLLRNKFRSEEIRRSQGWSAIIRNDGESRVTARVPPEAFRDNILDIVRVVRADGGRPILLDPNLANFYSRNILEEIAARERVPFLSAREILEKKALQGPYELKDPKRDNQVAKIQIKGVPQGEEGKPLRLFLVTVPQGETRFPSSEHPTFKDNGKEGDLVAGDGIYTATIKNTGEGAIAFAPATKILMEGMRFHLFINKDIFYRVPPSLEEKGLYYSPVYEFRKPTFHEYLAGFDPTLPNAKGARAVAEALVPVLIKNLKDR